MPDTLTPPTPSTSPKDDAADPAARLAAIIKDNDDKLAQGFREIREEEARRTNELRSREPASLKESSAPAAPIFSRPASAPTSRPTKPAPVTDAGDKEVLNEYYKKNGAEIERAKKILEELEAKKPGAAKAFISGTPAPVTAAPFDRAAAEARIQEKVRAIEEKGRIEMAEAARVTELKKKEINDRARADIARINKAEQEKLAAIRASAPKAEPKIVVAAPTVPATPVSPVATESAAATMASLMGSFGVLRSLRSERDMLAGNQKGSKKTEALQALWKKEMRSTRERLTALENEVGRMSNSEERTRLTLQLQDAQQQFNQALSGADTAKVVKQTESASKPSVMIDIKPLVAGAGISALGLLRVNADSSLKDIRAELEYTKRGMQPLQQAFAEYAAGSNGPQVDANGNLLDDKTYQAFQDELGPLSRRVSVLENLQRNKIERLMSADPSSLSPAELDEARFIAKEQLAGAVQKYNAYGKPKEWTIDANGNKVSVDSVDLELKAQVERLSQRSAQLVAVSVPVVMASAAVVSGAVTTTASLASSVSGSMQLSGSAAKATLTETRSQLAKVRARLVALNVRMDAYDRSNPGKQDSPESQAMQAEYAPLYEKFQKLEETERAQAADPTQMDGSGSLEDVTSAQDKIRNQMQMLNRRADSSAMANAPEGSPERESTNEQLDYLNTEYQRLDGLRRQKEEQQDLAEPKEEAEGGALDAKAAPAPAAPSSPQGVPSGNTGPTQPQVPMAPMSGTPKNAPSASMSGGEGSPLNVSSAPNGAGAETATTRGGDAVDASVDVSTGKIDFVDITIYTSFALGVDALGLVPVVGEVSSPLSILCFRILFWLKGMGGKNMNWLMALTGMTEVIPVASELMPGCTAFVLTTCLMQVIEDKAAAKIGATAQSPLASPQSRFQAAATFASRAEGDSPNTQTSGAPSSSSSGGQAGTPGSTTNNGSAAPSASFSSGGDSGFSGQADFSSFGQPEASTGPESRSPSGLPQGSPPSANGGAAPNNAEDGVGGRFAGGNPTSPGGAPTDPSGAGSAKK
jgi:hypothetical protein